MFIKNANSRKNIRLSLLLSLFLHGVIAIILGFLITESEQQKISEVVAIDMIKSQNAKTPPLSRRTIQIKDSTKGLKKMDSTLQKADFATKTLEPPSFRVLQKFDMPNINPLNPALGTDAKNFDSKFDLALPSASVRGTSVEKPGSGSGKTGIQRGGGPVGLMGGSNIIEVALYGIARNIIGKNKTGKEDIVFLIDSSGSMEENISAVARYIIRMVEVFDDSNLDYTLGIIRFNRILKKNDIKVYDQTKDTNQFKLILKSIKCSGDESIFDAIDAGFYQVKYRNPSDKTLVLVTDEPLRARPRQGGTPQGQSRADILQSDLKESIQQAIDMRIKISIIAIDDNMHKLLAKETNGVWFPIPQTSN